MGGMMGGFGGYSLIGLLLNLIIVIVVIGGLIWLAVWAVRRFSANGQGSSLTGQDSHRPAEPTPREIVEKRYARGEITQQEYQEMLRNLS